MVKTRSGGRGGTEDFRDGGRVSSSEKTLTNPTLGFTEVRLETGDCFWAQRAKKEKAKNMGFRKLHKERVIIIAKCVVSCFNELS